MFMLPYLPAVVPGSGGESGSAPWCITTTVSVGSSQEAWSGKVSTHEHRLIITLLMLGDISRKAFWSRMFTYVCGSEKVKENYTLKFINNDPEKPD